MATRDLARLSAAIQEFANSTRFNFLKTLQVGRFVGANHGSLGVVSEFTFEKLVELGTRKLAKLRWLTPDQEEQLIVLLRALAEGDTVPMQPPPRREATPAQQPEEEEELLSSAQVDLELRNVVKSVKTSPYYERIASQPLGAFWEASWPRAPFEEALTVEQLVELDLSILMKKRTMSNRRIRCITRALERALASLRETDDHENQTGSPAPLRLAPTPQETRTLRLLKPEPQREVAHIDPSHPWVSQLIELPSVYRAAAEHYLSATLALETLIGPLERLLQSIPSYVDARDFILLASNAQLSEEFIASLSTWTQSEDFTRGTTLLRSALEGPGVALATLVASIDGGSFSHTNAELGVTAVVRALGASEVRLGKSYCPGVWTLNQQIAAEIVRLLRRRRGDIRTHLATICPSLDATLSDWLVSLVPERLRHHGRRGKIVPH